MKPRNLVVNILLSILFVIQIIFSIVSICPWQLLFIGVSGLLILLPDWFVRPKHRSWFFIYKSIAQVLFIVVGVFTFLYGFVLAISYGVAEGFAQGCGGTVNHTNFDKYVAEYFILLVIPILIKIIMNIFDFIFYKKEK